MSYIVTNTWLKDHLGQDNIAIIDARFQLNAADAGREAYLTGHIPHAIYLDLNEDLAGRPGTHGGPRPLPDINVLAKTLGEHGVDQEKTVVIYDQGNGMFAARAWWLLHYMGQQNVYVLDGGFSAWLQAEYPVTDQIIEPARTTFTPKPLENATVDIEAVKAKKDQSNTILIDSRSRDRYLGEAEPLHDKAGHIPGAKHFFWKNVLNDDGTWKNEQELKENFAKIPKDAEIIVSCGSGVSACPNIIGLKTVGFENVKLYPGSFSDWISYPENPLETKEV